MKLKSKRIQTNKWINNANHVNVRPINDGLTENCKSKNKLENEVISLAKLVTNLNSMEKSKEDDHKTSYLKFKKYKSEAYRKFTKAFS